MLQKIIKVGNSYAVTIPKDFVKSRGVNDAQTVSLKINEETDEVVLKFGIDQESVKEVVDPEVYKVAKQLLKRYLPAFKELATK